MATNYNSEIPTQEWVLERQNYIGGSDVAAILGQSSFKTPLQVWMRKQGIIEPVESSAIMEFGNVFEPVMAGYFEDLTGLKTRRVNKPFAHDKHDFLRANIDRQVLNGDGVDGTGALELKTTNSHRLKALDRQYPIEWEYQIQHYLGLTGYQYGYLFIYERDTCEFYEPILVDRNQELISNNMAALIEWWNLHMIGDKRPEPQNEEDLLLIYPDSSDGKVVEASDSAQKLYQQLKQVREDKLKLEEQEAELKNLLKEQLGDGERLVYGGQTLVTWKSYSRQRLDATKLREQEPETLPAIPDRKLVPSILGQIITIQLQTNKETIMSLVIKEKEKEYPIPEEGIYNAVCVDVVDIGTVETPWGPKEKITLMFELDAEDEEGNRYVVGKRFTKSLNEKSNLRGDLSTWRNRKFKPREISSGFDLESLIDVSAIVYISHNETEKRTYANIESILPPEKSDDGKPDWYCTKPSGEYTRVIEREEYLPPEEYAASVNGTE